MLVVDSNCDALCAHFVVDHGGIIRSVFPVDTLFIYLFTHSRIEREKEIVRMNRSNQEYAIAGING